MTRDPNWRDNAVAELQTAARYYRDAQAELGRARTSLAVAVRTAYADGLRKVEIIRAIDGLWSRAWIEATLAPWPPPKDRQEQEPEPEPNT